ncbi:MAG TPA: ATP-binding cassette domain-containing protein, partial [Acidimicrobiia bacterium]|nr:ATP-binding cassette domain-containing protein [Acidimicrobiia bacterium]
LATLTFILKAPFAGTASGALTGPSLLLPALATAVVARMESLPVAFGAGVGLGVLEQVVLWNYPPSAVDVAYLIVILLALLLRRDRLTRAQDIGASSWSDAGMVRAIPRELRKLPEVRWARVALGVLVGAFAVGMPLFMTHQPSNLNLMSIALVWGMVAVSLVVLTGWGGQASLGQLGFVGVGAAIAGRMTISTHADLIVAVVVAGLAGAVIAAVIGLPALRLGGLELAVTTLAFALATSSYVLNPKYVHWLPTGRVPRQPVLGFIGVGSETRFYYVTLVGLGLAVLAVTGVRRSRTGRALIAVRENAKAARSYGVRATAITLVGFALSGFLAAAAGGLFIHHQQSLGASPYAPAESLTAFTMVVVGGLGSVSGALIGAAYVRGIAYFLSDQYRILASGTGLLFVLWLLPDGLGSLLWRGRDAALSLVARRHGLQRDEPDEVEQTPDAAEAPSPESTGGLLDVGSLRARYGHTPVLFGVDLTVRSGEIVALLGTNGAGKSTLLRAISGLLGVESGRVCLDGADTTGLAAHRLARRGIAHLPGGRGVFASLTVGDNMLLARRAAGPATPAPDEVTFPFMEERWNDRAGDLSGGQQQLLALAMVLLTRPKVLLIDELSLGLAPTAIEELLPTLAARRDAGTAILLVEQSVALALRVADRAYVLEKGRVVFTGSAAELSARPDVLHSIFLAGALDVAPARRSATPSGETVLRVSGATRHYGGVAALQDVNLTLADGEIVGLIGANGAGKTTLLDVVSGFIKVEQGTIELVGRDVTRTTTEQRARFGLGRSFQDARLFPALTVAETVAVAL